MIIHQAAVKSPPFEKGGRGGFAVMSPASNPPSSKRDFLLLGRRKVITD